jgi:hypothetical protein
MSMNQSMEGQTLPVSNLATRLGDHDRSLGRFCLLTNMLILFC